MRLALFAVALLLLASCGGGAADDSKSPEKVCTSHGGQWQQLQTHDAAGHTFNDYHCIGG